VTQSGSLDPDGDLPGLRILHRQVVDELVVAAVVHNAAHVVPLEAVSPSA
jgi:hypothetical protein